MGGGEESRATHAPLAPRPPPLKSPMNREKDPWLGFHHPRAR